MTVQLSLSSALCAVADAICRHGLEKHSLSPRRARRLARSCKLILATVAVLTGMTASLPASAAKVKIGNSQRVYLSQLLKDRPGLTLNDIEFTGNDPDNPGVLIIDTQSSIGGNLIAKHYGSISFSSSVATLSPPGKTLSGSAKYLGGIFSLTKDFSFTGFGTLRLENNHVQGDGGAIYSEASLSLSDNVRFNNNVVDYAANDGSMAVTKRPVFGSGGAIWVNNNIVVPQNAEFTGNLSYGGYGGAIYSKKGTVLFGKNATLKGNKSLARKFRGSTYRSDGGAVWAAKSVTFEGAALLDGNEAASGGAIYSGSDVTFNNDATLSNNKALGGFNYQNQNGGSGGAVSASGNITFGSGANLTGNTAVASGGALYSFKGNVSFTSNATLKNNTARSDGGAVYAQKDVSFGNQASLESNSASGNGGAIFTNTGSVSFGNTANLTGNTAKNYGGAIYSAKGNVTFGELATLSGNTAQQHDGGAIYAPSSDVTFDSYATLSGNRAQGGIAGAVYAKNAISFQQNTRITNNEALNSKWGYGGALYSKSGTISFGNTAILSGNKAAVDGGAVWAYGNLAFMDDATVTDNSAGRDGGALYSLTDTVTFRNRATLSGNSATGYGGAVYAVGKIAFGQNAALRSNSSGRYGGALFLSGPVSFGNAAELTGNTATQYGGGIYANEVTFKKDALLSGNRTLENDGGAIYAFYGNATFGDNATVTGNSSNAGMAGAIYANDSISFGSNAIVSDNSALNANWGYGGALYTKNGNVTFGTNATLTDNQAGRDGGAIRAGNTVDIGSGATLSGNSAQVNGGAIYAQNGVTFHDDTTLRSNRAGQYGGAVYTSRYSIVTGNLTTLADNEAASGGAFYAAQDKVFLGTGATVTGNRATSSRGGAIYAGNAVSVGDNALFSDNRASSDGGAIYSKDASIAFGNNASLTRNQASAGGALAAHTAVTFGNNATLADNSSTGASGGAIYAFGGPVTFGSHATLSGNTASLMGGVVFTQGNITLGDYATVSDNQARDATRGYGGALYSVHGSVAFGNDASVSGNRSGSDGGAIWAQDGSVTFGNGSVSNANTAGGRGGAIFSGKNAVFGKDTVFAGNTAKGDGGAIYAAGQVQFNSNTALSGNASDGRGGAIYAGTDVYFVDGASFTGNSAGISGGAIYAKDASVTLNALQQDIVFSGNTASGQPNAIQMDGRDRSLILNAATDRTIAFYDPVSASQAIRVRINETGGHDGTVNVAGHASQLGSGSETEVFGGTFALTDGARWGGTGNRFLLHGNSVLAAGGSSTLDAGYIWLGNDSKLAFDLASVSETGTTPRTFDPVLNFTSTAQISGKVYLDLLSVKPSKDPLDTSPTVYTLVSGWGTSGAYDRTLTFRGHAIENTRIKGLATAYVENNDLKLKLDHVRNYKLTWTGATSDKWSVVQPGNWHDDASNTDRLFFHGDSVVFNDQATTFDVEVDAGGNVVADMTVESGNYTFSGGAIYADKNASSLASATGKLTVADGARADFSGISGDNRFEGVDLYGTLVLGRMGHLGTSFSHLALHGSPELIFDAAVFDVRGGGNDDNRLSGGTVDLTLSNRQSGSVTSFLNSRSVDDGGAINLSSVGNLTLGDGFRFALNHSDNSGGAIRANTVLAGDRTVLAGNSAGTDGGAIFTSGAMTFGDAATVVLNRSGLSGGGALSAGSDVNFGKTATVSHNESTGDGGAVHAGGAVVFEEGARLGYNQTTSGSGGAIYTKTVSFGNDAILTGNSAENDGGAIRASGQVTLGNAAIFENNTANGLGGAILSDSDIAFGDGATLSSNSAKGSGGALFSSGDVFLGAKAALLSNSAGNSGGAVHAQTITTGAQARLALNKAKTDGGALYASSGVTAGDGTLFLHNSAGNEGGAILSKGATVLGKNTIFSGNTAGGSGGALYAFSGVTASGGTLFLHNSATINGGAIWNKGNAVFGKNTVFAGNTAGSSGGAVFAKDSVTLTDGNVFLNNSAGTAGGAIASEGDVTLKALAGNILFSGNTANGKANAIHMSGTGTTLALSVADGHVIAMNDPVTGGTASAPVTVSINQPDPDTYTGTVRFSGHRSEIAANTTVHGGTFELADGASWGNTSPVAGTAFTLNDGAVLAISGSKSAEISSDTVSFSDGSTVSFDPAAHAGNKAILSLTGSSIVADTGVHLSVSSIMRYKGAEIDLIEAGTTDFKHLNDNNLYYKQAHVVDTRLNGILTLDTAQQGLVILKQTHDLENLNLVWTGKTDNNWNFTTKNWKDANPERLFFDGDAVTFDNTAIQKDVSVNSHGVTVASMTIDSGDYVFSGGAIESESMSSLGGLQNMQVKSGASASFANDLSFAGGYAVENGAAMTYAGSRIEGDIANDGTFTFHTGPSETLVYSDALTGSGTVTKTGTGRFEIGKLLSQSAFTVSEGSLGFGNPDAAIVTQNGTTVKTGATLETGNGGLIAGGLAMNSHAILDIAGTTPLVVSGGSDIADDIDASLSYTGWRDNTLYPVLKSDYYTQAFTSRTLDYADGSGTLMRNGSYLVFITGNPYDVWPKGRTFNQKSTLSAIAALPGDNPVRDILVLGEEGARAAADMVSGEGYVSTATALMERMRAQAFKTGAHLSDRAFARNGNGFPASGPVPLSGDNARGNNLWVDTGLYRSAFDGNDNAARTTLEGPELAAGLDLELDDGWLAGAAFRFGSLESQTERRHHKADIDSYGLTLYGGREIAAGKGTLRLIAGAGYTWHDIEARRTVQFPGVSRKLESDYKAQGWQTFAEAAYTFSPDGLVSFEPYLNISYDSLHTGKLHENGSPLALTGEADTYSSATSLLGVRYRLSNGKNLSVRTNLGWMHTYGSLDSRMARHFDGTSVSFPIEGVTANRDAAVAGIGAVYGLNKNMTVSLSYDGLFGNDNISHSGMLNWTMRW